MRDTYGGDFWAHVAEEAGLGVQGFEALFSYDDGLTDALLNIASVRLAKPREALLEDLGNYLVGLELLRRLLRFGGADYPEFLQSLDELPDRVRL
ncbi:MAG: heme NO-binding domain-containing protein, partial [Paracoccaceae bacterium]|nr:heme NO-binding domain-containing protein [Paracoccaceae bacterium]